MNRALLFSLGFFFLVAGCVSTPTNMDTAGVRDAKYDLQYNTGLSKLATNESSFAMENFMEAEKYKKTPELYFAMGQACYLLKRYDLALSYFDKSLVLDKNYSSSNVGKGIVYRETGRYEESLAEFHKALENIVFHEPEKAYYNIALTYKAMNDVANEIAYLKSTIQVNSNFAMAYYQLALIYIDLKNYEAAADILNKLLTLSPNIPEARLLLGKVYIKLGKLETANAEFKEVIRIAPGSDTARQAQILLKGGDN
jgi:tetratricopeptide (TPR) repeat protein